MVWVLEKEWSVFLRFNFVEAETAIRQSSNRVLRIGFEVPCNSQVGRVAQPRTRSVGYAGYGLLRAFCVFRRRLRSSENL